MLRRQIISLQLLAGRELNINEVLISLSQTFPSTHSAAKRKNFRQLRGRITPVTTPLPAGKSRLSAKMATPYFRYLSGNRFLPAGCSCVPGENASHYRRSRNHGQKMTLRCIPLWQFADIIKVRCHDSVQSIIRLHSAKRDHSATSHSRGEICPTPPHAAVGKRYAALEDDEMEHQVESSEEVTPVDDGNDKHGENPQQHKKKPYQGDDGHEHVDLTA